MSASDDLEDKILDHVLGGAAYTPPAEVHVALYTSDPGEAGSAETNEVTGTGYARVTVGNDNVTWDAAAAGVKANAIAIDFGTAGAGGWGTATHFGLVSTASGVGDILFSAALTEEKLINAGDTVTFAIGALTVTAN